MRRKNQFFGIKPVCFLIVMTIVLCLSGQCLAKGPAPKKAKAAPRQEAPKAAVLPTHVADKAEPEKKPAPPASFGVPAPQDAAAFFEEARKLAAADPVSAVALYQRGMMLKPDAWKERKELGALYEKQGQWNMALAEYETIFRVEKSAEISANRVRMLDKTGYPRTAAAEARKAFAQYPGQPQFLLQAGELYHKSQDEAPATAALQEYLQLKPDDGKALILLGSVYEKTKKPADALNAYLRAEKQVKGNQEAADAVKRLRSGSVVIDRLTIFLPRGWAADKDGLTNLQSGERVTVSVKSAGSPAALALTAAREAMPQEPFSKENLKQQEQLKKMRQELSKKDPEAAKNIPSGIMPLYTQGDFPPLKGAKKAVLSTSETIQPGMESAVAAAVPAAGEIYVFLWRASLPAADGEKTLGLLLEQAAWPL
jgi:tetratricopeptide (TPR) repeat protein